MTSPSESPAATQMTALLTAWMPSQRWFAGKGRPGAFTARLLSTGTTKGRTSQIWLADVAYDDGGAETYQVPVTLTTEPIESLDHVHIGALEGDAALAHGGPEVQVYDALHDKVITNGWLDGIRDNVRTEPISFVRTVDAAQIPVGQSSLVLTGEQSNTSLVFGDAAILKVFRRLDVGENPDVEVHRALGALAPGNGDVDAASDTGGVGAGSGGGRHVARMLGYVQSDVDGETTSLAMLQEFMTTATDGWELAKISVRDLMGEGDLHASEAGGDFAGEATRLGVATAEIHLDLARAFGTEQLSPADLDARANAMHRRLDLALAVVPQLAEVESGLRRAYAELRSLPGGTVRAQRVHGDLHLGQVLRTVHRWVVLDFEGEPSKSIAERRLPDSPLRDVAGMLRSFDYVARHQLVDFASTPQTEYRATEWATRNRDAFAAGYASVEGSEPIDAVLLRAYEADKAVYEAVYEARNRPSWLAVPLASLTRLAAPPAAAEPTDDQKGQL
ncbi:MAG: putative pep2 protein [Pseudonocardiales bacterium]|nr:putative pep2 protein [Pseudonocardiales bacterium]